MFNKPKSTSKITKFNKPFVNPNKPKEKSASWPKIKTLRKCHKILIYFWFNAIFSLKRMKMHSRSLKKLTSSQKKIRKNISLSKEKFINPLITKSKRNKIYSCSTNWSSKSMVKALCKMDFAWLRWEKILVILSIINQELPS